MKNHEHKDGIRYLSTIDIIKRYFLERKMYKNKMPIQSNAAPPAPPASQINHLAIILDGEVQEIMRAENRLAALLLSEPKFVEFDPDIIKPEIGWEYIDEKFVSGE
jgi:hypothetical protein